MAGKDRVLAVNMLSPAAFAPYGQVITPEGAEHFPINNGNVTRFHDLADIEAAGPEARVLVSMFRARHFELPIEISMMERHPLGSQAFIALHERPWLAVVAPDDGGRPGAPNAFLIPGGDSGILGINYARNSWHHPLLALDAESDFLIIDRGGKGNNLEEMPYPQPYSISSLPDA